MIQNARFHLVLSGALLALASASHAAAPSASASATISPPNSGAVDQDSASGPGASAHASASTALRDAEGFSSTNGFMQSSARAHDGGIAQLASGAASVKLYLHLDGPAGASLSGRLVTHAQGSGTASSTLGSSGSLSLASFHYRFQTAADTSAGSVQWTSQAGMPGGGSSGGALVGTTTVTPTFKLKLDSAALGSVTISPSDADWLNWQLPKPQASVFPIQSIGMMSSAHADAITAIRRAIDLYGIVSGDYDPLKTKVSIGIDMAYSFDAEAGVDLSMRSGGNDILLASISSGANATAGGAAQAQASGEASGPSEVSGLRFELPQGSSYKPSDFHLRVDGSNIEIPIVVAVPEPGSQALLLGGLGLVLAAARRRGRAVKRNRPDDTALLR